MTPLIKIAIGDSGGIGLSNAVPSAQYGEVVITDILPDGEGFLKRAPTLSSEQTVAILGYK